MRPIFPKIAGSSDDKTTGTPWFSSTGRGCIGIDDVSRWKLLKSFCQGFGGSTVPESLPVFHCCVPHAVNSIPRTTYRFFQGHLRNRTNLHSNTLRSANFHKFRVLDQREAMWNGIRQNPVHVRTSADSPVSDTFRSQQDRII